MVGKNGQRSRQQRIVTPLYTPEGEFIGAFGKFERPPAFLAWSPNSLHVAAASTVLKAKGSGITPAPQRNVGGAGRQSLVFVAAVVVDQMMR